MDRKLNENKHGYVIQYFADKGYGFIAENKTDDDAYFFHISNLEFPFEIIPLVTRVEFNLKTTSKGLAAVNIKKYIPIVDGTFGNMQLPYTKILLSNKECYGYINTKQIELQELLNELTKSNAGINVSTLNSGWISINITEFLSKINDIKPDGGKWKEIAPSGYPDTFEKAFDVLQNQINYFNKQYIISKKGYEGENKTDNSLKSISINYPILHNVLLEEGTSNNKFSAETDTLIITDKGIFIIETKNYGGKRDIITISNDGRWSIFDGYKKTSHIIANNPYKQTTDHIFVIKKFLEKNKFNTNLALIPIIAISNDNVELKNFADLTHEKKYNRGEEEFVIIKNHHEPIVSKELFKKANEMLDERALSPEGKEKISYRYPFSGKIKCGICGSTYVARYKRRKDGSKYKAWRCGEAAKHGKRHTDNLGNEVGCSNRSIQNEEAIHIMYLAMKNLKFNRERVVANLLKAIRSVLSSDSLNGSTQKLKKQIEELSEKHEKLLELYMGGCIEKDEFTEQREKLNLQIDGVKSKIDGIRNGNDLRNRQSELYKDIEKAVNELIDGAEYEDEFYKQILDKMVIVDKNTIDLYLNILPEKWRFSVSKTIEPIYEKSKAETQVPISVNKPFSSG